MHINQYYCPLWSTIILLHACYLLQSPIHNYFDFGLKVKESGGGTFSSAGMRGRGVAMGLLDRDVDCR